MSEIPEQIDLNREKITGYDFLDRDAQYKVMCAAVNDYSELMESTDFGQLPEVDRMRIGIEAYWLLVARETRMMEDKIIPGRTSSMAERTLAEGYRLANRLVGINENVLRMGRNFDGPIPGLRSTDDILNDTYRRRQATVSENTFDNLDEYPEDYDD